MEPDEDQLIVELRAALAAGCTIEQLRRKCMLFLEEYRSLARKACWAYRHHLRITQRDIHLDAPIFIEEHLRGWCDFFLNAAKAPRYKQTGTDPLQNYGRKLIIGWHCPEYPLWMQYMVEHKVLTLVARRAAWINKCIDDENLYFFRAPRISSALARAFRQGRPIFAMMDYCYDGTASIVADFLGYPAKTPVGLLQLARRCEYEIVFWAMREGLTITRELFSANSSSVEDNAARLNKLIESEVLMQPARWLLWGSVDRRWIGVDYEA